MAMGPNPKGTPANLKFGGSRKGIPNKIGRITKENFVEVFNLLGGVDGMLKWARRNRTDFYKLYARLIPADVTVDTSTRDASEYSERELYAILERGSARIIAAASSENEPSQVH